MVTLKHLVELAFADNEQHGKYNLEREAIEPIVKAAIHGLGFHIAEATGEVCDPRPKPHVEFQYNTAPRWNGGPARRRR